MNLDRIFVCADIHGLGWWKDVVPNVEQDEHVVFLGDYVDPYQEISEIDLMRNLNDILKLKTRHPDNVTLLLGNHDLHYLLPNVQRLTRYNRKLELYMMDLMMRGINDGLFHLAAVRQVSGTDILFTHAGVSTCWLTSGPTPFDGNVDSATQVAAYLNNLLCRYDPRMMDCGPYRRGNEECSGPVWLDIREVVDEGLPMPDFCQVVGHTKLNPDVYDDGLGDDKHIFCCDIQHHVVVDGPFISRHFSLR